MESSRSALNLEQTYRDMMGGQTWDDYLGSWQDEAWIQALDHWVADGNSAYDWYQDMLKSFPAHKETLFQIYSDFIEKYGFAEATEGRQDPGLLRRPANGAANGSTNGASSPWPNNESAFIGAAVALLAILIYAYRG